MYGGKRRYLRRMMRRYTVLVFLSTAMLAVIAGLWSCAVMARTLPPYLLAVPVFLVAVPMYFSWRRWGYRYGIWGEEAAESALSTLDNRHRVFNALVLPGAHGDIDHVVVGPGGVFVLETKNYAGEITCFEDRWMRRRNRKWEVIKHSPSRQAIGNARRLDAFLKECTAAVKVDPVVVLANRNARIRCENPAVPIVRRRALASYIESQQCVLSGKDIRIICEHIHKRARVE
jgi:hypothetical protein